MTLNELFARFDKLASVSVRRTAHALSQTASFLSKHDGKLRCNQINSACISLTQLTGIDKPSLLSDKCWRSCFSLFSSTTISLLSPPVEVTHCSQVAMHLCTYSAAAERCSSKGKPSAVCSDVCTLHKTFEQKDKKSMHTHFALLINNRGCCMGCGLNEGMHWGDIQVAVIRPSPAAVSPVPSLRLPLLLSVGFFSPVLMTYKTYSTSENTI